MIKILNLITFLYILVISCNIIALNFQTEKNIHNYLENDLYDILYALNINIIFLIIFYVSCFMVLKFFKNKKNNNKNKINAGINKTILNGIIVIFLLSGTLKIINAFSYGILNFIIDSRINVISIGSTYAILLSAPLIICLAINGKKSKSILYSIWLICITLNLMTGYRLILMWTLLVVAFSNYEYLNKINKEKIIKYSVSTFIIYIFYEIYRGYLQDSSEVIDYINTNTMLSTFIGLSRSGPITYIFFIDYYKIEAEHLEIIYIIIRPFRQILEYIGVINKIQSGYEVEYISENLFRNYLVWRGTPYSSASGISMHIVPYLYAHGNRITTVLIGANILGYICAMGIIFLKSTIWHKQITGALICSLIVSLNESATTSGLFIFGLISVIIIRILLIIKK
jgi:hypothetical protein